MLFRLASDLGVDFQFGTEVVSVEGTHAGPIVRLSGDQELRPDMVVGADSRTSLVRGTNLVFHDDDSPEDPDRIIFGGIIPVKKLLEDPELGKLAVADEVRR